MQTKRAFLTWQLLTVAVAVLVVIGVVIGLTTHLRNDPTHLTWVAIVTCAFATIYCGRLSWRLSAGEDPEEIAEDAEDLEYASSLQVSIGLIGTTIGYFLMLAGGANTGDPSEIIRQTFAHASVAIVNTAVGAVTGLYVEIQYRILLRNIRRKRRERAGLSAARAATARDALAHREPDPQHRMDDDGGSR